VENSISSLGSQKEIVSIRADKMALADGFCIGLVRNDTQFRGSGRVAIPQFSADVTWKAETTSKAKIVPFAGVERGFGGVPAILVGGVGPSLFSQRFCWVSTSPNATLKAETTSL
jgi:hypothetical protein